MLLSFSNAAIRTGDLECFSGLNWQINDGEKWAVVGPTGSGKTILARGISRQYPLAEGQVHFYFDPEIYPDGRSFLLPGEILTFSAETHQAFLHSFSAYHQARWQSFEGDDAPIVSSLLDPTRMFARSSFEVSEPVDPKPFQVLQELLYNLFGINKLNSRKVHLLSHGESRKVFLTYLLLRSPKLLILDDPFTGLDEESRLMFQSSLEDFFQTIHQPVLLLTSRAEDVPPSFTHLLLLDDKKVVGQGRREEIRLWSKPEHTISSEAMLCSTQMLFTKMVLKYAAALESSASQIGNPFVEMRDVSVTYQGTQVLKNIDWVVSRGDRWALRGANGAGKTTLLSLILGDNPQVYSNKISMFGKPRGSGESIWQIKQRIGWISPELHIFYDRSIICLDVVNSGFFHSIGLYHQCTPEQISVSQRWMRALDIDLVANKPLFSLSTGQQRLVLLARALVKDPPMLILDEPCQGLDDQHRKNFIALIDEVCHQTSLTLIYVTHYQDELPASITQQIMLERGMATKIT
jgi:molybdate transport system ATP-binding protein